MKHGHKTHLHSVYKHRKVQQSPSINSSGVLCLVRQQTTVSPYVRVLPNLLGEGVEHSQPQQVQESVQVVLQERRRVRGQGGVEALQQGSDGLLGR